MGHKRCLLVRAAPSGDPVEVATKVIGDNFDWDACKAVVTAVRMTDGSIMAQCVNEEMYRVFGLATGKSVAARCKFASMFC